MDRNLLFNTVATLKPLKLKTILFLLIVLPELRSFIFFQSLTQAGAGTGALYDGVFAGVVEDRAFGQGNVRRHPRDGYPGRDVRHGRG